ncbi:hypothetical protein SISNIDRAFT_157983 [Sistotremastrum niveocremeum HHB9708]|uniref:HMG box domain-containing protein n=1 Tax=Sistotremastrum niveocremeum HHB9708 TaxID=1314777 RepID=A0A164SQS2_9AGAM|nr:hypothetical protein SISNIDRAFT_157983 [Sistotremastrum niveocremeum HHB9708]
MNNFSNSHLPDAQMAHHLAQHSRHPLPSPTDDPNHHNGDPNLAVIDSDHDHELDLDNEHSPEHSPEQGDAHAALTSQSLNVDGTPKRPMNAFMIFARRRRPQVSAANHMMRTGEISKILSKEWNAMTMSDKQFYLDQAKKLKENFNSRYPDYVYRRRPNNSRKRRRTGSGSTNTGSVGEEGRDSEEAPDHPREEPDDEYSYASGAAFPHPSSTAQSSSSANTSSSVLPYPERFNQLAWPPLSGGPLTLNTSAAVTRPHASISPSVPSSHSHRPFHSDDISAWRGLPSSVSDSGASFRDLNPTSRPSTNWFSPTTSSSSIHDIATPSSNTGGAGPHNRHRSHSLLSLHTKSKTEPWTPTLSHSSLGHPLSSISTNPSSAGGRPWSASTSSGSSDSGPPHTHAHIPRSVASPPEANTEFEAPTAPFFPSSSLGAQRPSTAGAPSASHGAHLQSPNDYFAQMSVLQHQQHPSQNLHHHQPSHPQNSGNVTHSMLSSFFYP